MRKNTGELAVFCLFFSVPLLYAIYTNHAWEDWFITYQSSKNLAMGNGLVYRPGDHLHTFTIIFSAGLIALALYLPGLIWPTVYYSTPVLNTVVAKGLGYSTSVTKLLGSLVLFPVQSIFTTKNILHGVFTPPYPHIGGWPVALLIVSKALSALAILYWIVPKASVWGKIFSFTAFVSCFYLSSLTMAYPWCLTMGTLFCIYALAQLLDQVLTFLKEPGYPFLQWDARFSVYCHK